MFSLIEEVKKAFLNIITARKTIISFFRRPEKMFFPKKSRWNIIFLVLSGKIIFIFPKNMILHLRRKMKNDLSQKKYTEIWYFLQTFWKDGLSKKDQASTWSFLYYLALFFSQNLILFPWAESERRSFSRNKWKYDIFCVQVQMLQTWRHAPLSKKVKDGLIPQKYT